MRLKVLDHETLVRLNDSSIRAGRSQNLGSLPLPRNSHRRYSVNFHDSHIRAGQPEMCMCIVLDAVGQTAWLDVSLQEFASIPEVEVSELEWSAAMCAGNPPPAP